MSSLQPVRKLCPHCGKPMKLAREQGAEDRDVCPRCEGDPLHDPAAQKWAASPLKPPAT
jgi:Zn-finger nucleic acid-binding protein